MKIVKRIVLGLFCLVLLIAVAVFVLITFYKKEMAQMLVDQLKTDYSLSLKIEDADVSFFSNWPQASVKLKDISIESLEGTHKNKPLLKAGSISLSFNIEKLLQKQFVVNSVSLKDAEILMVKNTDGTRNFDFKKKPAVAAEITEAELLQFEISKILIKNTRFRFINHAKKQDIDLTLADELIRVRNAQDGMQLHLTGGVNFARLLFNEKKGAFLENTPADLDLNADIYFKSKMIVVHPGSYTTINKQRYDLNAFIQLGDSIRKLALRIESDQVDYEKGGKLLTPKLQKVLSNFTVDKPFDVKALIIARLDVKEDPVILVNVNVKDNAIKIGNSKIPYSNVFFKGSIISLDSAHGRGASEYARIAFNNIKGNIYDFPFTAAVKIVNLNFI